MRLVLGLLSSPPSKELYAKLLVSKLRSTVLGFLIKYSLYFIWVHFNSCLHSMNEPIQTCAHFI